MKILALFYRVRKYSLIIVFIFCISCSRNLIESERGKISTEIICSEDKKFMIRYAYENEVREAIKKDYERKIREKSNENFTVIRIPNIESFHIQKMPPEKLIECRIVQNYIKKIYPNYIKKFKKIK